MDIRIVNTCNNDCLYCLEGNLRQKQKFINKDLIFNKLIDAKPEHINFYGGNPLLHPDLIDIIIFCKNQGIKNISLLTNSFGVDLKYLIKLKKAGLDNIGVYFNSLNEKNHFIITGDKNTLRNLLNNLKVYKKIFKNLKCIIHVNKLNISTLYKDIVVLNKNYGINEIDFVNYFPFDKPYENKDILAYLHTNYINEIRKLFCSIVHLGIKTKFFKFSKDFFGNNTKFYNFENGVIEQIGIEDKNRLSTDGIPFCYTEKRCSYCFIKDNCSFLLKKNNV